MTDPQYVLEILKWGMGGAVLVVIFWKFIPTLFEFLQNRKQQESQVSEATIQAIFDRISRLEKEHSDLRSALSEMRVAVGVSQAILVRIETQLLQKK